MLPALRNLVFLIVFLVPLAAAAQESGQKSAYVRVHEDEKYRRLQTSVTHLVGPSGQRVDLVAATHLADKQYFQRLNKLFQQYDMVLFEMVLDLPEDQLQPELIREALKPENQVEGSDPLSALQQGLADLLGLSFQLNEIDYTPANFRHADLTLAEFVAAMESNDETPLTIVLKLLRSGSSQPESPDFLALSEISVLKLMAQGPSARDRLILKRAFAVSFDQMEEAVNALQGTTLLQGRNTRALEVLEQQLKAGHRKVAVFYGAAHMPDLEARLHKKGWKTLSRDWITAWNLGPPVLPPRKPHTAQ